MYSTDQGRIKPESQADEEITESDGIIRLSRETKGRKGAGVTLITGFQGHPDIKKLAKRLKQLSSSGGTIKQGVIEIQGDHRTEFKVFLEKEGHTVKVSGA